ncbi:MAG TPA: SbmA/BacA-like family transporter, partial [Planctomycetaceae bacterium]|nr:SbmA/BacA-like family transporter [Planctomycetaceae bacterium]
MDGRTTVFTRATGRRLLWSLRSFLRSEIRWRVRAMLVVLVALPVLISGLNVVNSYINRDFMTAIAQREGWDATRLALLYLGSFAALTAAAVSLRFTEERLGLLWRYWLTARLTTYYFSDRTFLWIKAEDKLGNPDQRIAEDVRTYVTTAISFLLIVLNSTFAVFGFAGVLWSIQPVLLGAAFGYAVLGSLMTMLLGWPLARLNSRQYDREADLRSALIHVRENAESVALTRGERCQRSETLQKLDALVKNFRKITSTNRNLGVFTTAYNYLVPVLPVLIVAPLYFRGEVEFGVLTQSAIAFGHVCGAVSLIITQFNSLSSFVAVIGRLSALGDAIESARGSRGSAIEVDENSEEIFYEQLTLRAPEMDSPLLSNLSLACHASTRLLVTGPNEAGRLALFRATAGLWPSGSGKIARPALEHIAFVPQRPYLVPGTLRDVLACPGHRDCVSTNEIFTALEAMKLKVIAERSGGLDERRDWSQILSLGDQQRLVIAA